MQKNKKGCPHCEGGFGLKYTLYSDEYFWIVCDAHPLIEGHILIIPKEHISCMGALSEIQFTRLKELYKKVLTFLSKNYGKVVIFEHGITGQTVFHAHMHFLPFNKSVDELVPEKNLIKKILTLDEIKTEFSKNNKYLFIAVNNYKWLIDTKIGYPRFFRDRISKLLGTEERNDWKKASNNDKLIKDFENDIQQLQNKWKVFFKEDDN